MIVKSSNDYMSILSIDTIGYTKFTRYFNELNHFDKIARKSIACSETDYVNNIIGPTDDESDYLVDTLYKTLWSFENINANDIIYSRDLYCIKNMYQALKKNKMSIHVCLIHNDVENGLPHTHSSIITLPHKTLQMEEKKLITLMCHETIHILQRYHADMCNFGKQIVSNKYLNKLRQYKRSNPDIEGIYDNIMIFVNDRHARKGLRHASIIKITGTELKTVKNEYEHPFEKMAYENEEVLSNIYFRWSSIIKRLLLNQ